MKSFLSRKERCNRSLLSSVSVIASEAKQSTASVSSVSSSLVSPVSSVSSSVKLSSCKHSSSSCIHNGSFIIRNGIGFTLVELMIVIAIIGVLAASLFPMMSGYMAKARDTARMNELRQLSLALGMYKTDKGTYLVAGTGYGGGGLGWINFIDGSYYTKTLYQGLQEGGYISSNKPPQAIAQEMIFSSGLINGVCGTRLSGSYTNAQMLYFDDSINKFSLSTHLERPTEKDISNIQTIYYGSGWNGTCTTYGMNYGIEGSY